MEHDKITFLTMLWGEKYPVEYVNNLYNGIARNTNYSFDFVCMTDQPSEYFREGIKLMDFYRDPYQNGWWTKLDMFRGDLPIVGKIVYLDLDMVIVGNIDWIFENANGDDDILLLPDAVPKNLYNSSFVKFTSGKHSYIIENSHLLDGEDISLSYGEERFGDKKYWGDQIWMSEQMVLNRPNNIFTVPDGSIKSLKFELGGVDNFKGYGEETSIILFTGDPLPHEAYKLKEVFNSWVGDVVIKRNRERVSVMRNEDLIMRSLASKGVTYWYVEDLNPNMIVGSVGRCGSGPNTVWDDWTPKGIKNKQAMEKEYMQFMNGINGHYDKLLSSIERQGQLNPLLLVRGIPFRRTRANFPYREWAQEIAKGRKYVMEGVTGGSRLWALQKLEKPVRAIIIERGGAFSEPIPNARRLTSFEELEALYTDDVILKMDKRGNITEEFGTLNHHHLGEYDKNSEEVERLIFWRELNASYGYKLKLNPQQIKMIEEFDNEE